jgi:excisionase family DNA binding protein
MEQWRTEQQVREYLQISRTTLWRLVKEGHLAVYHIGGSRMLRRFKQTDLDALLVPEAPAQPEVGSEPSRYPKFRRQT